MGNIFCPPSAEVVVRPSSLKSSSFADTEQETISLEEIIVSELSNITLSDAREILDDLLNMITFINDNKRRKPKLSEQINWKEFLNVLSSLERDTFRKVLQIQDVNNGNETLLLWILYVEGGPPKDVVKTILKKYPEAAKAKDKDGCSCLHYTVWRKSSADVVKLVMDAYPNAIFEEDDDGMTPLHWIQSNTSLMTIRYIIQKEPDAIKLKDKDGWTCLHYCIRHNTSTEIVKTIVDAYPQAVLQRNEDDETPLHCVKCTTPIEVIKIMTEKYPKVALMVDKSGRTPLQCAKEEYASKEVIEYLTETIQKEKLRILWA